MYDGRLGRRWNVDPVLYPFHGGYTYLNNNPLYYTDPLGLYATKEKAEKMQKRAKKAGYDPGEVYQTGKNWVFNTVKIGKDGIVDVNTSVGKRYFGSFFQKSRDFVKDINPIKETDIYAGLVVKTEINLSGSLKLCVPFGGVQTMYNSTEGYKADIIKGSDSYLNIKKGNIDIRLYPIKGLGGDYDPGFRALYKITRGLILVPVFDVPVPVGEYKVQGEMGVGPNGSYIGMRTVGESFPVPTWKKGESGIKLELNGGVKFKLKLLDIITD